MLSASAAHSQPREVRARRHCIPATIASIPLQLVLSGDEFRLLNQANTPALDVEYLERQRRIVGQCDVEVDRIEMQDG